MKSHPVDDQPAGGFPPQIEHHCLGCLPVRQAVQGLQHQHRGDHIGGDARPAATGGEKIGEHLRREQCLPVLRQEREDAAAGNRCPVTDWASNNSR